MILHYKTPLIEMHSLCSDTQSVHVKMEAYQPCGSFKIRGVENFCNEAIKNGAKSFVCPSGGNAGLAVAYYGKMANMPVTVFVPKTTPESVIKKLENERATVFVRGEVWDETLIDTIKFAEETGAKLVPSFDSPHLWTGHATMIDELKEQCLSQPDLIVCSVGGGGMLCGIVEGLIRNGWSSTAILAVETEGIPSFYNSVKEDKLVTLEKADTIASCLCALRVTEQALKYAREYTIKPFLVSDEEAAGACVKFAEELRTLVEPACGATLGAMYFHPEVWKNYKNIVVIACGGGGASLNDIVTWKNNKETFGNYLK